MAEGLTKDLQGVNTGHLAPTPMKGSTHLAETVTALGNAGNMLGRQFLAVSMEEDLQTIADNYLKKTEDYQRAYSPEEDASAQSVKSRLNRLAAVVQQKGDSAQVQLEAEALIKQYAARYPGMIDEYHKIAKQTLGFDPSGSAVKARQEQLETEAALAKKQMEALDKDAQTRAGLQPGELFHSKEGRAMYDRITSADQAIINFERRKKINDFTNEEYQKVVFEMLPQQATLINGEVNGVVVDSLRTMGLPVQSVNGIVPFSTLSSMNAEQIKAMKLNITSKRNELVSKIASDYTRFKDNTQFEVYKTQLLQPFDDALTAFDSEENFKLWTDQNKFKGAMTLEGANWTGPAGQNILAYLALGVEIPDTNRAVLISNLIAKADGNKDGNDVVPTADEATPEALKALRDVVQQLTTKTDLPPKVKEDVSNILSMQVKMMDSGVKYDPKVYGEIINTWADNPALATQLKELYDSNPRLMASFGNGVQQHASKSLGTVNRQIAKAEESFGTYAPSNMYEVVVGENGVEVALRPGAIDELLTNGYNPVPGGGALGINSATVGMSEQQLNAYKKQQATRKAEELIKPARNTTNQFNTTIRVAKDITREGAAAWDEYTFLESSNLSNRVVQSQARKDQVMKQSFDKDHAEYKAGRMTKEQLGAKYPSDFIKRYATEVWGEKWESDLAKQEQLERENRQKKLNKDNV